MRTVYRTFGKMLLISILAFVLSGCHSEPAAEEPVYTSPTIVVGQAEAHQGDTVTLPVHIYQSPGIAACRLIVEYNNEFLEMQSYTYGEAFSKEGDEPARLTSPVPFSWSQLESVTGDELFAELTFTVSKYAEISESYPVTVRYAEGDLIDIDENPVEFTVENGSVAVIQ